MKIVFHGKNASTFLPGFAELLDHPAQISVLPDDLADPKDAAAFAAADVVIGIRYSSSMPPVSARLYQLPAAGYDGIDFTALPAHCTVCNAFGHERAIAEYVMTALLMRHVPIADADKRLRAGDWHYWAGGPNGLRTELGKCTIGVVGHGHIGKEIAARALAFGMSVHVANRSPIETHPYAAVWPLDRLKDMLRGVDYVVNTLPLAAETRGMIGAEVLAAMAPHAVIVNVGRGAVIDETALFEALSKGRIGGAILDTWYVYPSAERPNPLPGSLPFEALSNVIMTPHMSGWTEGTVWRRTQTCAANVNRLNKGLALENVIRAGSAAR